MMQGTTLQHNFTSPFWPMMVQTIFHLSFQTSEKEICQAMSLTPICLFLDRELDPGLQEAVSTLIWAAPRLQSEVNELKIVSSMQGALTCLVAWTSLIILPN